MPIYEYQCSACGHSFEELVFSASAEKELTCPKCGKADVSKKMSCFSSSVTSGPSGSTAPAPPSCGYT